MDKKDKQYLGNILFDAIVNPIKWRPMHLTQVEKMVEFWVKRDVEQELKRREENKTDDGC